MASGDQTRKHLSKCPTAERRQYSLIVSYVLINHIGGVIHPRLHRPGPATIKCPRSADRPAASSQRDADNGSQPLLTRERGRGKGSAVSNGVCHLAVRPNCRHRNQSRGNGSTALLREKAVRSCRLSDLTRELMSLWELLGCCYGRARQALSNRRDWHKRILRQAASVRLYFQFRA
jgi:hypothetical protein